MLPFNFNDYWAGVAVDDFKIHIELDINLTPSQPSNEISIPLLGSSGLDIPFDADNLFSASFTFDPQIYGWVNSTSAANFSYGFDAVIPDHSAIWVPLRHLDNITTIGFNESTITPINFTSSNPNLDFDFELSFRPLISLSAKVEVLDYQVSASVYADVPKLNLAVSQVLNVTSDCESAPTGTEPNHIYSNLTLVVPSVSYDVDFSASDIGNLELGPYNGTALPTSCLDYSSQVSALISAPVVNPTSSADKTLAISLQRYLLFVSLLAMILG
jgi:hypothetical protein